MLMFLVGFIGIGLIVLGIAVLVWNWLGKGNDMAMADCGPQDPGAPVAFQLRLLFNELCELHAGKQVGRDNWTVSIICQMAMRGYTGVPAVPDIRDKDIQDSKQARESLADWLRTFAAYLNEKNRQDCLAIGEALGAW